MIIEKKSILEKIFSKKSIKNFEEEKNAKNLRAEIYKHIARVSEDNAKLINMRYELLYAEYTKRYHINLSRLAESRRLKTIEYAELCDKEHRSKHVENLYKLAKELF